MRVLEDEEKRVVAADNTDEGGVCMHVCEMGINGHLRCERRRDRTQNNL